MTGKIFINYRRGDDAGHTGRLFDRLQDVFDPQHIFMDVDNIGPGLDFVRVLNERVAECDIVLAVIGKGWLAAIDAAGSRRLDDPADFVRIEIESALTQDKRIIPVLVGDAQMPRPEDLPEALRPLARRNAVRLTHERFRADVQGLIKALTQTFEEIERQRAAEAEAKRRAQEEEERKRREEEAARRAEAERKAEAARRDAEEEERKRREAETARRVAEERRLRQAEFEAQERAAKEAAAVKQRAEAERAFAAAKRTNTSVALDAFLETYGGSEFAEEARILRAALLARQKAFRRTSLSNDAAVLRSFLTSYDTGTDADQVRKRLQRLEAPSGERTLRPAMVAAAAAVVVILFGSGAVYWFKIRAPLPAAQQAALPAAALMPAPSVPPPDQVAWLVLRDTTDNAALKRFIQEFPSSPLRKNAEARIADLTAQAAATADATAKMQAAQDAEAAAKLEAARRALEEQRTRLAAQREAELAAQEKAAQQQAALSGPQEAPLAGGALVQQIKMELTRVGCYGGPIDEDWSSPPVKLSIARFVKNASLAKTPNQPTLDFLDTIRGQPSRVCPLECAKTERELNGACVAKTCPSGQTLDSDGDCATRRRPAPRPAAHDSAPSGGGNTQAVTGIGISCGRFGCREHKAHSAPTGLPCKNAWQDRQGAFHCT